MPQTFGEEINRSIWSRDIWADGLAKAAAESGAGNGNRKARVVRVRDYKDKFIIRLLQEEARRENPGFLWYDDCSQEAFVAWSERDGTMEPAGYALCTPEYYDRRTGGEDHHWYPNTLNQVFVRRCFRRNGIGTFLVDDFIARQGGGPIWVESPKWETRTIMERKGYEESDERYEVWQMREGLTCWRKRAGK